MQTHLSVAEKHELINNGFVIIRDAVNPHAVNAARQLIESYLPRQEHQLHLVHKLVLHHRNLFHLQLKRHGKLVHSFVRLQLNAKVFTGRPPLKLAHC